MNRARQEPVLNLKQKMTMLDVIRKMSLRTRLALLATFALIALIVVFFVAWRLAHATEMFALRQADTSLHAASRDLARAIHLHPTGYQTIEEAVAQPGRPTATRDKGRRQRPLPPHVKALFAAYDDSLSRLTAIILHRYPDAAGGFYQFADDALVGRAFPANAGMGNDTAFPLEIADAIRALSKQANETGTSASRTIQTGSDRIIVVAYPVQGSISEVENVPADSNGGSSGPIAAAWTMQRLSNLTGLSNKANLAALAVLILSIIAVTGLALVTVRDLRSGVAGIEDGLTVLTNDLNRQITPPPAPELMRITLAINHLADTLRVNLARQSELEHDLRRSERLSALGRLTAGVAHEVRNPLAAIKLKVQMALRVKDSPDKLNDTFRVVTEEIDRLDGLVRRLLEFGRTQPLKQNELDLCELVRRRAVFFSDVAERAGLKIDVRESPDAVMVDGDRERLGQVLDNLIQNSLSAMSEGGRLTISCHPAITGDGVAVARLTVEDTGRGIPAEDHERIFEPFYTARESGTGLGLAIAREIIEAHGGRLSFVSSTSPGAIFHIELPQSALPRSNKQFDGLQGEGSGGTAL